MMKRTFSFLSVLALGSAMLHAAPQLYDITLTSAEKFTQCRIAYESETSVKFTGINKAGKEVTKEVKASSILLKKEVKTKKPVKEQTPAQEEKEPVKPEQNEPEATQEDASEEPAPAVEEQAQEEQETAESESSSPTPVLSGESSKIKAINPLKARVEELDKKAATIQEPSRSFSSRFTSTRSTIDKNIEKLEKDCDEVDTLQAELNALVATPFSLDQVQEYDRTKYAVDGKAAYDAMVMDMNQKKSSRKIGGLDKFEILRESYQGIPEYKEAHAWYIKTLKSLERKWEKAIEKEEAKREKLNADKRKALEEKDRADYQKLEDQLEKDDEHIAQVWFNPSARNLLMLRTAKNKADDALRRNERAKAHEHTGAVCNMINQCWRTMDEVKDLMVNGKYDEAKEKLEEDDVFKKLVRLNTELLPEDYKKPIKDQREELSAELKKRIAKRKSIQRNLDQKRSALERQSGAINNHIERLESMVADALADQNQEQPAEEQPEEAPAESEE